MEIKCEICGYVVKHEKEAYCIRKFNSHLREMHGMNKEKYIVAYELNGEHPTCACGCGNKVKISKGWNKWDKYYKDHKNFVEISEETKIKISIAQNNKDKFTYLPDEIINNSFYDFKNNSMSLENISKKYNYDRRTLRDAWIYKNKATYDEYKKIASINNCKLGSEARTKKIMVEYDFYNKIHDFILNNPYKYNINQINNLFGKKHTVTTLFKNLSKLFPNSGFEKLLKFGFSSKEETFYIEILRFFFGKTNVRHGFRVKDKIYDALLFNKVLLEYDGSYYHSDDKSLLNDKYKNELAIKEGYVLIRCNESSIKDIDFLNTLKKWENTN